jgi:hypothetical protein
MGLRAHAKETKNSNFTLKITNFKLKKKLNSSLFNRGFGFSLFNGENHDFMWGYVYISTKNR